LEPVLFLEPTAIFVTTVFKFCWNQFFFLLEPAPISATTIFKFCWNQPIFLLPRFLFFAGPCVSLCYHGFCFLLEPVYHFATTVIVFCWKPIKNLLPCFCFCWNQCAIFVTTVWDFCYYRFVDLLHPYFHDDFCCFIPVGIRVGGLGVAKRCGRQPWRVLTSFSTSVGFCEDGRRRGAAVLAGVHARVEGGKSCVGCSSRGFFS